MRRIDLKSGVRVLLVALAVATTQGCAPGELLGLGGTVPGGDRGRGNGGGAGAAPGAAPGQPAGQIAPIPPQIGGPGVSPDAPATSILPPPEASRDEIGRLVQKFGIRRIAGSGATLELLKRMEQAYDQLPAGSFQDLDIVFEPSTGGLASQPYGAGAWIPTNNGGNSMQGEASSAVPAGGRVTYMGNVATWPLIHEVGHHVTLYIDADFGHDLIDKLGYKQTSGPRTGPNRSVVVQSQFDPAAVPPASFPTRYSQRAAQEHVAELVANQVTGGQATAQDPVKSDFKLPEQVGRTIARRFPRSGTGAGS